MAEGLGEGFEEMVEFVADGADVETGGGGDVSVALVVVVFETEQPGVLGWQFGEKEAQRADGLVTAEFGVGWPGVVVRKPGFGVFLVAGGFAPVVADFIQGEIADATVRARRAGFVRPIQSRWSRRNASWTTSSATGRRPVRPKA